jgi:sugar lactone lactonase YvrE/DNA-directed RNA polymerase subunit RPC12/RpoP
MKTFDCPKCGAPVTYEPNTGHETARCSYCGSQLALPDELRGRPAQILSQIDINIGPQIAATTSKLLWVGVLIPISIVVIVVAIMLGVFAGIRSAIKSAIVPTNTRGAGSRTTEAANAFATVVLKFGSEGIGPGMMTDARNIAVDGKGNIYVGDYIGGRIQVFDSSGQFITQWMIDRKMPLRGLTADRKGTVFVAQHGIITRYEGQTGKSLGEVDFSEGAGFDDVIATPDGGLLCAWYRGSDDIIRLNAEGKVVQTIRKAISTVADRSELNTRLAIDGLGNIYALGSFTSGVFKFSPDGKFLNRFGGSGSQPGQLNSVNGIAVDGKGRVFVSDSKGIQVFDSDGRYLAVFKPEGVAFGMVFNAKNELLVAVRKQVMKFGLNQ